MRRTSLFRTQRTPGYVFWRQKTLLELEKTKRNYLLNERPFPLAEITRRMIRIRHRYEDSTDFHERNLLRGEYKYFTGKLCDLRGASVSDMISFLESGAFFAFWDTSQIDRVIDELVLRLGQMTSNELVHLLQALSGVRKHRSKLYDEVARELCDVVEDVSFEDAMLLLKACEIEDPPPLILPLLDILRNNLDRVEPARAVQALGAFLCIPQLEGTLHESTADELRRIGTEGRDALTVLEVAQFADTLRAMNMLDRTTRDALCATFLSKMDQACARSTSLMVGACQSLSFTRAVEERILFFLTDFTTSELQIVLAVYMEALASIELASLSPASAAPSSSSGKKERQPPNSTSVVAGSGTLQTSSTLPSLTSAEAIAASSPPASLFETFQPLTAEEIAATRARHHALVRIIGELLEQLLLHVSASGTSHIPRQTSIALLRSLAECVAHKDALVPFPALVREIASRLIRDASTMDLSSQLQLLQISNQLGPWALQSLVLALLDGMKRSLLSHNADVTATRSGSSRTSAAAAAPKGPIHHPVLSSAEAASVFNILAEMTSFVPSLKKKVDSEVLPLLRRMVSEKDADILRH